MSETSVEVETQAIKLLLKTDCKFYMEFLLFFFYILASAYVINFANVN